MIDLHIHSRCSDGSMRSSEIVQEYRNQGFRYIAITDHDVICSDVMAAKSSNPSMKVLPGVEISSYDYKHKRKVHLLGYSIDENNKRLRDLIDRIIQSRHQAAAFMINGLQKMGYQIMESEVADYAGEGGIYKQHILHCLRDKGYVKKLFGDWDRSLFAKGGKLYYPIEYVDYREGMQVIKEAGGLGVLAHPGQHQVFDLVTDLTEEGLDGIETYHPTHSEEDREKCRNLARKFNLFQIPGSDNHGIYTKTPIDFSALRMSQQEEEQLLTVLEGVL